MSTQETRSIAVYIHVPFCRARCLYCAFPSRPAGPTTQTQYIEDISREIINFFDNRPELTVRTVYVGGGTPSTLNTGDIEILLKTIHEIAPRAGEITFEVNPHADDLPKIPSIIQNGVNRLSIGVQSFNDEELSMAGRLHDSEDTRTFIRSCRELGITNISFDLIHGLPVQTLDSWKSTLRETIGFAPEHVSLYGLTVESDSRLGRLSEKQFRSLDLPDGDNQASMYDLARSLLIKAGYEQYEISNFAKPGYECAHNLAYWTGDEYIGFGPGATSYVNGARFRRLADVDGYIDAQVNGKNTVEFLESLSTRRAAAEALVMGLRLSKGINRRGIETRFGIRLTDLVGEALDRYREQGFIEIDDETIRLNESAYFVSNSIFRDLIQ